MLLHNTEKRGGITHNITLLQQFRRGSEMKINMKGKIKKGSVIEVLHYRPIKFA